MERCALKELMKQQGGGLEAEVLNSKALEEDLAWVL